ncbi:MAG: hypothetical protein KF798_00630 [Candidatus Paracaedibacteraceae bacterium]|nr:hypothetical protein [Candidatus Paracaedibacteraceae bacterium]
MLKPILTLLLLSTPLFAIVPDSGNTQIIKTNKETIQPENNPSKNQGMQEVFAQIRKNSSENKAPRLLTPQIEEITFKKEIADGRKSLESNEIFHILWKSGVMKPIPANTESTLLDLGDDTITTKFGEIITRTGGFFSQAIYEVILTPEYATNPDNAHFIIKQIGWGNIKEGDKVKKRTQATPIREIQDLNLVRQELGATFTRLQSDNPLFPKMALHNTTFFYFDTSGRKNYLTVMPIAQGTSAQTLAKKNQSSPQEFDKIMAQTGRSLGEFHYQLASDKQKEELASSLDFNTFRTVTHGDFHLGNILISGDIVSFIDNASIADSLKEAQSPFIDIIRLYSMSLYIYNSNSDMETFRMIKHSFLPFIHEYIEAYPSNERESIQKTILNMLETFDTLVKENAQHIIQGKPLSLTTMPGDEYYGYKKAIIIILHRFKQFFESEFLKYKILKNLDIDFHTEPKQPPPSAYDQHPKEIENISGYDTELSEASNSYKDDPPLVSPQWKRTLNPATSDVY